MLVTKDGRWLKSWLFTKTTFYHRVQVEETNCYENDNINPQFAAIIVFTREPAFRSILRVKQSTQNKTIS